MHSRRQLLPGCLCSLALVLLLLLLLLLGSKRQRGDAITDDLLTSNAMPLPPAYAKCKNYAELRGIDFQDPRISGGLCEGATAYRLGMDGRYPVCQLARNIDQRLLQLVRRGSVVTRLRGVKGKRMPMLVYPGQDLISETIRNIGVWEQHLLPRIVGIAALLPSTTFLDVGSNIGVFTLAAAQLKLSTVSLDANIRNLLRLRLSLIANGVTADSSRLVWNFISGDESKLWFLNLPSDCNMGAATKLQRPLRDTVPVMSVRADRLADIIATRHVVVKLDIEGEELEFFQTADALFRKFTVVAILMEFMVYFTQGGAARRMADILVARNYSAFKAHNMQGLDTRQAEAWDIDGVLWIRSDFVPVVTKMRH